MNTSTHQKRYAAAALLALLLAACGTVSNVSRDGTTDHPVWPDLSTATLKGKDASGNVIYGSTPDWNNVRSLKAGMNKEQIMQLIGRPHFYEGFGVREWDYVLHHNNGGQDESCRLKILFDKHKTARTFLWQPESCGQI